MRIHTITDNAVERIELKVDGDTFALSQRNKLSSGATYPPKTIILNQQELATLHSAIHKEEELLKKKGEGEEILERGFAPLLKRREKC